MLWHMVVLRIVSYRLVSKLKLRGSNRRTITHRPSKGMPLATHQALDISDQAGTLAIVTGAHSGIGRACQPATDCRWGRDDPCRCGSFLFFVCSSVFSLTDLSVPERSASWHSARPRIKQ